MAGNNSAAVAAAGNQGQASANSAPADAAGAGLEGVHTEDNRKIFLWVTELLDPNRRETALMELSKKREQVPELALVIWHSFGTSTDPRLPRLLLDSSH